MLIVNLVPNGEGWDPINYMVSLAGEMLEAEVISLDRGRHPSAIRRLLSILNRRSRTAGGTEKCLLICAGPLDLQHLLNIFNWRRRFKFVAAWVIDSFWLEWIPRSVRYAGAFDQFFVTSAEDVDQWSSLTKTPTTWLPWGTDALRLGSDSSSRQWDLTRVGRQPQEWDDDAVTAAATARMNVRFHPRPQHPGMTPIENHMALMRLYGHTKFLLAFSNAVNPTNYTHPTRQYLTGRWVDALGAGAVVAGAVPREPSIDGLLWPQATIELDVRRERGLSVVGSALKEWTPALARTNHEQALRRLDWRWRFKILADAFEESPVVLGRELKQLEDRLQPAELVAQLASG